MDKSASQSRLSRSQLPSQEVGNGALRLDQLTDLDQAISLSRGGEAPETRPTPVATHSSPKPTPTSSAPALPKPAPVPKPAPKPTVSQQPLQPKPTPVQPAYTPARPAPTPTSSVLASEEPPVVPVRSAKEAINAMYAGENPARLSDYLGASAKEIINATARGTAPDRDAKSASSLHHASSQRKIETSRPSASAIFRAAKSEKTTPVVHTSIELEPKPPRSATKPRPSVGVDSPKSSPIVINSRSRATNSRSVVSAQKSTAPVRPKKGQIKITTPTPTAIAVSAIEEAAGAITKSAKPPKPAKSPANPAKSARVPAKPTTLPKAQTSRRPALVDGFTKARPSAKPVTQLGNDDPYQKLPADSVKRRFRLAPKGFAANKPEQARPARRKFMSFSNPDYTVPVPKPSPAVEIYGLTEPEPAVERDKDGLGIVEDYRPQNPANPAMNTPAANNVDAVDHFDLAAHDSDAYEFPEPTPGQKFAARQNAQDTQTTKFGKSKSGKSAPDNNRYSLSGQSPFFLKSVNVEKRPLSDAPTRRADTISPIYTDLGDEVPRKNIYDGKSKSAKSGGKSSKKGSPRDLPQRPTVIIPSSRRSHTPLFLLLILTVILGAAVGAAVYFFFFQ